MKLKETDLLPTDKIVGLSKHIKKVKWSLLMQDIHSGDCEHDTLTDGPTDPDGRPLEYFTCHEPAFCALQKITMDQH